jgi:hypothetical protein
MPRMTRTELMKRLAESATRPITEFMHQPLDAAPAPGSTAGSTPREASADLFVWFEDTSTRFRDGRRGIAGLPESLLPVVKGMRIVERRYAEGHLHILAAVRIRCTDRYGERVAAVYTAALSVGTIAWIGTGGQYEAAWRDMYPYGGQTAN